MIQVNELRAGNWVMNTSNMEPFQITPKDLHIISVDDSWVEPIELTSEILEDCGFVFDNWLYKIKMGHNVILKITGSENYIGGHVVLTYEIQEKYLFLNLELKTLHQLQNFYFAHTNNELNYG